MITFGVSEMTQDFLAEQAGSWMIMAGPQVAVGFMVLHPD